MRYDGDDCARTLAVASVRTNPMLRIVAPRIDEIDVRPGSDAKVAAARLYARTRKAAQSLTVQGLDQRAARFSIEETKHPGALARFSNRILLREVLPAVAFRRTSR